MRVAHRLLAVIVCLCLFALPVLSEEEKADQAAYLASLPIPEGETLIAPDYPVPAYALRLIETAQKELGYTEEKSGVTKYGTWAGDPTAEWCAEFLCWCVSRVDAQENIHLLNQVYPNYSGTNTGRNWFIGQGRYVARTGYVPGWGTQWWKDSGAMIEKNSYVPQPGDWMFLTDNAAGDTCHVALVAFCTQDGQGNIRVHVIEGNNVTKPAPQSVERNAYPLNYWKILGYGTVYDLADITLRFGSDGPKVKALQEELVQAGLLEPQYTTGRYGAITTAAIKALQSSQGIAETGIANHETQLALHALAAQE